ncbi:hypothetical protein CYY_009731 [Polysphondylium violaceum]|uniref:Delta(14)-sterol reductase n=1 Tax=Polysphondylium violaceum TaxID=133409 RepID=A0A8J4PJV1_9MYCE|nr:hypothetical protein CYY_009731 [Polysphondylium violaceum]
MSQVRNRNNTEKKVVSDEERLTDQQKKELADLKKVHPANEFGGIIGTFLLTFILPVVVYWIWASLEFNEGYLLRPAELSVEGIKAFFVNLYNIVMEHAYPTKQATIIYFSWFFFQAFLQHFVPGRKVLGSPLPGGKRLEYTLNGWASWWITMIAVPAAAYFGLFKATILYDNYGSMLTVVNIWSFVFTFLLKIQAKIQDDEERMSGHFFYDFWMGFARNPRIGSFDLKLFCEARPGLILWVLMNFSIAAKQYETYGFVSISTLLVCAFHAWYIADYYYHEEAILTTMDIITEKFGYMLVYGDLAWVPFTYCFQCYYLYKHLVAGAPIQITIAYALGVVALKCFGFYLFRWVNSQKHEFRRNPDHLIWGKKPDFILTKRGTKLLCSGFWGICRHLNYTGDIILSWAWCLPCLFDSPAPYFYGIYFTTLDLHRCWRDHNACLEKYGDDWRNYCKRVPYVFIPRIF